MGHMKKSWGKTIKTILGVLVGNLVLSFAVAAFTVPNGIIMGGATGIGPLASLIPYAAECLWRRL